MAGSAGGTDAGHGVARGRGAGTCHGAPALGGTGDRSFLPQLRAAAGSDRSEKVRGYAFEGLPHLLARESMPDLMNGTRDSSEFVRQSVASHAFNMARDSTDTELRAEVRRLLVLLSDDPAREV